VRRLITIVLIWALAGCATLASKETFVVCQAADIVTTVRALKLSATAVETNPIPLPLLFALKIGLMIFVWNSEWNEDKDSEVARAVINVLSCAPILGNLKTAKGANVQ